MARISGGPLPPTPGDDRSGELHLGTNSPDSVFFQSVPPHNPPVSAKLCEKSSILSNKTTGQRRVLLAIGNAVNLYWHRKYMPPPAFKTLSGAKFRAIMLLGVFHRWRYAAVLSLAIDAIKKILIDR
jgi:hypothetical protein